MAAAGDHRRWSADDVSERLDQRDGRVRVGAPPAVLDVDVGPDRRQPHHVGFGAATALHCLGQRADAEPDAVTVVAGALDELLRPAGVEHLRAERPLRRHTLVALPAHRNVFVAAVEVELEQAQQGSHLDALAIVSAGTRLGHGYSFGVVIAEWLLGRSVWSGPAFSLSAQTAFASSSASTPSAPPTSRPCAASRSM